MADRSTDNFVGILLPWELTPDDLDASLSSYTQDGPLPGSVDAPTGARLQIIPTGEQDGTTYIINTRRGGNIGPAGAAFTWTIGAEAERGWDAYNALSTHRFLEHLGSGFGTTSPHATVLPNGTVVVVAYQFETGVDFQVRSWALNPTTGAATEVDIYTSTVAPTTRIGSSWHPTVCTLPDGSVICAHLIEDTSAEEAQVRVHRSTDSGATWTEVSPFALAAPIDIDNDSAADGFRLRKMRLACNGDQVLLHIWHTAADETTGTFPDGYHQYGSTSLGLQFSLVEIATENGTTGAVTLSTPHAYPDVCVLDGLFFVAYASNAEGISMRALSSAFQTLSSAPVLTVQGTGAYTVTSFNINGSADEGDLACFSDPDGSLYVTMRDIAGDEVIITRSADAGESWIRMGDGLASGTRAWWPDASATYPTDFCGVVAGSRALIYGHHDASSATYEGSLSEWALGGWSSVNMPPNTSFGLVTGRAAWIYAYIPADVPGSSGMTTTTAGTHSGSVATGRLVETTTTGQRYNTRTLTGTLAEGVVCQFVAQQAAGSTLSPLRSGARAHIDNGGIIGYGWQIRMAFASAQIALYDDVAGTIIGSAASVSWANEYEVRVEIRNNQVQAWYRVYSAWGDKLWISLASGTLTNSGGGGTSVIEFGTAFQPSSTTETRWRGFYYCDDEYAGVRSLPLSSPADLAARPYVGVGRSTGMDGSLGIYAVSGPGRAGESYTLAPRYEYPIDAVFWTSSPSPREQFRNVYIAPLIAAQLVTLAFKRSSLSENTLLPALMGVFLGGLRGTETGVIKTRTAAGATTSHAVSFAHSTFTATRNGNVLTPSNAATTGRFLHRNEAMGWWVKLGSNRWRQVVSNTEGVLAGGAGIPARLTLASVSSGDSASPTCTLVPDQALVLLHNEGVSAEMVIVELDNIDTPDDRHYLGACWVGEVIVPGRPWENGERVTINSGGIVAFSEARIPHASAPSPAYREGEVGFTTVHHAGDVEGTAADPDYVKASSGGSALPAGVPAAIATTTEGLVRYANSARPVVIIQDIAKLPNGATKTQVITGRHLIIPCYLTGPYSFRRVVGDNNRSSLVLRGEAFAWTEVI